MLPGLASIEAQLLHSLSSRHRAISALEAMLSSGLRSRLASHSPADFLRADRLAFDATGARIAIAGLLRVQERIASATAGIDQALARLDELDALLSLPAPVGLDLSAEVDELLARFDGAVRAAGSAFGERLLGGERAIRSTGGHVLRSGAIRVLRAPHNQVDLVIDIQSLASPPTLTMTVPPESLGQPLEMRIDGPLGSANITVASTDIAALAAAIDAAAPMTGVHAAAAPGGVTLTTPIPGSASTITAIPISGAAALICGPAGSTATGSDAAAVCSGGFVEARGNVLRVVRHGVLLEVDARGTGQISITTLDGGLLVRRSATADASLDARLGIPLLLADQIGFDGLGRLSDLRSDGALPASTSDPVLTRAIVNAARNTLLSARNAIADFEASIVDRDRMALEALLETLDAAEGRIRLADLPTTAAALAHQRYGAALAQSALEALFAQSTRLLALLPAPNGPT